MMPAARSRFMGPVVILAILVRLFLPPGVLDLFYDYDIAAGSNLAQKIHPGTHLLIGAALLLAWRRGDPAGRPLFAVAGLLAGLTGLCAGWAVVRGNTAAVGFLIDAEFAAAAACLCLSKLTEADRRALLPAIVFVLAAHTLIAFGESAAHRHVFPYRYASASGESVFRPTGLLNHPLTGGLYLCAVIPFCMLLRLPLTARLALAALFAVGTFAAEARFASVIAVPTTALAFLLTVADRRTGGGDDRLRLHKLILGALIFPLVGFVGMAAGLGERLAKGLSDQSSKARFDAYALLGRLSPSELLTGVGATRLAAFSAEKNGMIVESPVVALVFGFGLPLAVLFLGAIGASILALTRRSNAFCVLGAGAFAIVAASNNGLTTKTPELLFILSLLAASRGRLAAGARAEAGGPILADAGPQGLRTWRSDPSLQPLPR